MVTPLSGVGRGCHLIIENIIWYIYNNSNENYKRETTKQIKIFQCFSIPIQFAE